MNTLYLITKVLTYPGAFMKGFWEHVTCRVLKLRVTDRGYLRANEGCGHAAHTPAMTPARAFLFSWLPYLAQRALGWIFVGVSAPPLLLFGSPGQMADPSRRVVVVLEFIALFVGLSLLCNSFPQWEDAKRHWRLFYGGPSPEEEQAMAAYSEALPEAFDAEETADPADEEPVADEEPEPTPEPTPESEPEPEPVGAACQPPEPESAPALPEMPEMPRFARLAGKILLAPCNAYFLAGAWLERYGIPAILAIAITVAALALK